MPARPARLVLCLSALLALGAVAAPAFARFEPVTCRNSFTQDSEVAEGNKVASQVYGQMPVLPENDPTTRYVQQLGARLVQFAPLAQGVTRQWPFTFHVVASADINAFALPGGSIFVNLGTVQAAETEAQLAGVMAHEISHVVMRHSTCNLGKQRTKGLLYGLGALGSSVLLGNGGLGQIAQAGIGGAENLDFLHMSRDDEKQADLLGVNILNNAGYDPRGLPQFFETIKAKYGAGGAQFLSDHPNPGNRTEYVDAEIATLSPAPNPTINTAAFRQEHTIALREQALTAADVKGGAWKQSGHYASQPGSNGNGGSYVPAANNSYPGQPNGTTQSSPQGPASTSAAPPLTSSDVGVNDRLTRYQASNWSISIPQRWKPVASSASTASPTSAVTPTTLAPPRGAGAFGIAYGVLIGVEQQTGNGVSDASSLTAASAVLARRFLTEDPTLSQSGATTSMQVAGRPATATTLRGTSPVSSDGSRQPERDWLVTVARPDGDLCYLVFVSPERDSSALQPLFERMLATFSPQ